MHLTIQKIRKITPLASGESNNLLIGLQKRTYITFPDKALRAELWTLVKSEREKFPDKVMETVAKEYGHEILRLPPYHCELNPIELAWAAEKNYVAGENKDMSLD